MRKKHYSLRDIARVLSRAVSTLCVELQRNKVGGAYSPHKAHYKARIRRRRSKYQGKKIVEHKDLQEEVEKRLYDDQSPQAIARRISLYEKHLPAISKDSIYRYIQSPYGRRIETHRLFKRHARRIRKRHMPLPDRVFIDQRPKTIEARKRIGDSEADFIVSGKSGQGILLVVVDRKTRAVFLEQIIRVCIPEVEQAFLRVQKRYPEIRTITTDNDVLFRRHKELEGRIGVCLFFCHPYHSWEKGSVENTNKVIRRDIPKGSSIASYTKHFIRNLEDKLNRRPMKCLRYRTPQEVLQAYRIRRNKKQPCKRCSD